MEYENKHGASGTAKAGLTLGIIGSALGLLNNGNLLGGVANGGNAHCGCSEDHFVNRYEAAQSARIAELETEVKLRDANTYTDSKIAELYRVIDGRFGVVESQICQQNVVNAQFVAQVTANIACMQNAIATLNGLTKTVIPITSVCPEPMPQYNSWTAPTAGA